MQLDGKELTREYLSELQALPLERKIQIAQARIIDFYNRMEGRVVVSFSGGKDSTVLLDLVRSIFPEVKGVFCNTGLEYPEVVDFVKDTPNIDIIRPEKSFRKVIEEEGFLFPSKEVDQFLMDYKNNVPYVKRYIEIDSYRWRFARKYLPLLNAPFKISHKCCAIMKKKPIKKYQKEHNVRPYIGLLAAEGQTRQKNWLKYGCNSFVKGNEHSMPLSVWKNQDIIEYIEKKNLPISKVYGRIENGKFTRVDRTGCIFCLAGILMDRGLRFRDLKETHPNLYNYCMKPKTEGGLGIAEVLDWINENIEHRYIPIDYGQFDKEQEQEEEH